jgi:hypothetical protein
MKEYEVTFQLGFQNTTFVEADSRDEAIQLVTNYLYDDYKVYFDGETLDFDEAEIISAEVVND